MLCESVQSAEQLRKPRVESPRELKPDEIDLHIAPVLLGDGIRRFDNPGPRRRRTR
jgi:hypothetical protein